MEWPAFPGVGKQAGATFVCTATIEVMSKGRPFLQGPSLAHGNERPKWRILLVPVIHFQSSPHPCKVPRDKVESRAVQAMLGHGYRSILYKDAKNVVRWGAKLCNLNDLKASPYAMPAIRLPHLWEVPTAGQQSLYPFPS